MKTKQSMQRTEFQGVPVSPGVACGVAFLHISGFPDYKEEFVEQEQIAEELGRLEKAFQMTRDDMENIRSDALASHSSDLVGILEAQILILNDEEFIGRIKHRITESRNSAAYAFTATVNEHRDVLSRSQDPYMREMIADIETISSHILKYILGEKHRQLAGFQEPAVLFSSYFNPGEILEMPGLNVKGFVTEKGGPTSHMSLFAKSLGIPAIVAINADLKQISFGCRTIIDGSSGKIILNPADQEWEACLENARLRETTRFKKFEDIQAMPSTTRDHHHVEISANLDLPTPADDILAKEKVSIGLYRTEFLYLKQTRFPSEDEQTRVYQKIAEKFAPQQVIIRTFDLGGDKLTDYFKSDFEMNPALGWRAIRFSLDVYRVFETQLRAILRASAVAQNLSIMLPLITKLEEVSEAKKALDNIKAEMQRKKIAYDPEIKFGIMIETPAAVLIAEALAAEVDFFSIGTNDLTQYTLAVDRNNRRIAKHFQTYHPAVLLLVRQAIEAGHKAGIPVGICGELAGDPLATKLLVGMGVDALSMNPASIPVVKAVLPKIEFEAAKEFTREILKLRTERQIYEAILKDYKEKISNHFTGDNKGVVKNG